MKSTVEYNYKQSVDQVFASFIDPEFVLSKYQSIDAQNIEVDVTEYDDGSFDVVTTMDVEADFPRAVQKFIKPSAKMTTTEEWSGAKGGPFECAVKIRFDGIPAKVDAVNLLIADGKGCINQATSDLRITLPMGPIMRRTLESFIHKMSQEQLDELFMYMKNNIK